MRNSASSRVKRDIDAEITDQIIAGIESDPGSFTLPWRRDGRSLNLPVNAKTGAAYSGINILGLWVAAARRDFVHPIWATYAQWSSLGAQVRKGERASTIIFYKQYDVAPDADNADDTGRRRVARASAVFNAAQVEGFVAPPVPTPVTTSDLPQRLAHVDAFITSIGADIRDGGDRAYYNHRDDFIQLPDPDRFTGSSTMTSSEALYATALHELVHWTGAAHRLDRKFGERFGDQAYAAEELVAELGAAFLCAELQITQSVRRDHVQYLAAWLKLLKSDNRAIFVAASQASAATRYLSGSHDDAAPEPAADLPRLAVSASRVNLETSEPVF